jgi:hypothetical protein
MVRCGCQERVAEDVYCTTPVGHFFGFGLSYGAGKSYAAETSSAGAAHDDDDPDLGLDLNTMADVLSQLKDAPDPMQPSQALEVCNKGGHQKKTKTPFNCVLVFHFQKAQC